MRSVTTMVAAALLGAAAACSSPAGSAGEDTGLVLVSLSGEDRVVSVRPDSGAIVGWYLTGPGPHEIAVSTDRRAAFVANSGSADGRARPRVLSVLDLAATAPAAPLDLGRFEQPHDVRVSRDGTIVWAAVAPSQTVVEVDSGGAGVVRTWDTGADGGWFLEVTPDGRKIYVPHLEGRRVTVLDRTTGERRTVYDGGAQSGIAISPDGREVWVVAHEDGRINVVATATDEVIAHIELVSTEFGRIAFTPDGAHVALVQGRRLGWIEAGTRREVAAADMPRAGKVPSVSPDGRRLAVSNPSDDSLTIVDLPALRVIGSHPVGRTPDGVFWVR